jgi:hypothetical protein
MWNLVTESHIFKYDEKIFINIGVDIQDKAGAGYGIHSVMHSPPHNYN